MELWIVLGLIAVVGISVALAPAAPKVEVSRWQGVAEESGLTDIRRVGLAHDLAARHGALEVLFEGYMLSKSTQAARLTIRGLTRRLAVRSEGVGARIGKALTGISDTQIGDPAFDRALLIEGVPALGHALMDAETRKALMDAFKGHIDDAGARRQVTSRWRSTTVSCVRPSSTTRRRAESRRPRRSVA